MKMFVFIKAYFHLEVYYVSCILRDSLGTGNDEMHLKFFTDGCCLSFFLNTGHPFLLLPKCDHSVQDVYLIWTSYFKNACVLFHISWVQKTVPKILCRSLSSQRNSSLFTIINNNSHNYLGAVNSHWRRTGCTEMAFLVWLHSDKMKTKHFLLKQWQYTQSLSVVTQLVSSC